MKKRGEGRGCFLVEVIHVRPVDVAQMLQMRHEAEGEPEVTLWPATFSLGGLGLHEHEDGREGYLSQMAEGQPSLNREAPG